MRSLTVTLKQQVRLGYDADDLAVIVEDGKRADPVAREQSRDVLAGGAQTVGDG